MVLESEAAFPADLLKISETELYVRPSEDVERCGFFRYKVAMALS